MTRLFIFSAPFEMKIRRLVGALDPLEPRARAAAPPLPPPEPLVTAAVVVRFAGVLAVDAHPAEISHHGGSKPSRHRLHCRRASRTLSARPGSYSFTQR